MDLLDAELTDDGILLRPQKVIDSTQAWFWSPSWQAGERAADADRAAGRVEVFESGEAFVEELRVLTKHAVVNGSADGIVPSYAWLARFRADFAGLSPAQQTAFLAAVEQFVEDLTQGGTFRKGLRVKGGQGASGIFEMTWAADGRATFEYGDEVTEGQAHVVWRRVGTHSIFKQPSDHRT